MELSSMLLEALDAVPVMLSLAAIVYCSIVFPRVAPRNRLLLVVCIFSMFILTFAQTSWSVSYFLHGSQVGMWWADRLWTIFNTSVVIIVFMISRMLSKK